MAESAAFFVWGVDRGGVHALEECPSTRSSRAKRHFHLVKDSYVGYTLVFLAHKQADGTPGRLIAKRDDRVLEGVR